ncbi:MAG TPA: hypothetical protein VHH88_02315 [Verrucomicrobiae bacterium]|nr:hypothetical protein [Verrucomicrobiae bacterium]
MPKWCKMVVALVLFPICVGEGWALARVFSAAGGADTLWVPIVAGAGCWLAVYLLLPKPMLVYVFGHELTHAIWTWAFGGRVKRFKVTSRGGHVLVTRSNFLVALAPYFFPLYAMLVVVAFLAGRCFWNWEQLAVWFHLLLGAAYAFHVTLTWHILKHNQTDITEQGYLFSAAVIFLGNVGLLLVGIPLLARSVSVLLAFQWWIDCTGQFIQALARLM